MPSDSGVGPQEPLPIYLIHWNAPEWLQQAIASIEESTVDTEITVIENGCPIEVGPGVTYIVAGTNSGFAGGANIGLRRWLAGASPYCVVGSHDLVVEPGTLEALLRAATQNPAYGILASDHAGHHELGRSSPGIVDHEYVHGMCLLLRRTCIAQIGLFDERFHSYNEDVDLCIRAWKAGWRVGAVQNAWVQPLGSVAGDRARSLIIGNNVLIKRKHEGYFAAVLEVALIALRAARHARRPLVRRSQLDGLRIGLKHLVPDGSRTDA